MTEVIVVGGGAAGMMAAVSAAEAGNRVTLLEHTEKTGKKIYITGKGRCNVTNACEISDFFSHVSRNEKFLYSAVYSFDNQAVMQWFEAHGTPLKTERGARVFPQSDHASDIIRALNRGLKENGVRVRLNTEVTDILTADGRAAGVKISDACGRKQKLPAEAVILATGGMSYPSTGSDGSGFRLVKKLGHTVTKLRPSLVPMETKEPYIRELQGLSLRNVQLDIYQRGKCLYEEFGELMFTHFGITGPLVLRASSLLPDHALNEELAFYINLKPALDRETLDNRILRDFSNQTNRKFGNSLNHLLPSKLIPVIIRLSGIPADKKVNAVTREERHRLTELIQAFPGTITGVRGFREAIITRGGVSVKEVDPSTMESRLIPGLYLTGEMLDTDAVTGGFNLQIAWSTGHLAGSSIAERK
jgi:predicted Rossmann fold flavoprotein